MGLYLIFDLDGTLVDSCTTCIEILSAMLAERGVHSAIDEALARPFMSRGGQEMVKALLGKACGEPALELADFRRRYQQTLTPASAMFPGVPEGLAALRQAGYLMAICSNKPQHLCEKVLGDIGLDGMFEIVVGSTLGLAPKPAPDLLNAVLDRLEVRAADCLFIGDSEIDHDLALAASMPFHLLTYGYANPGWTPERAEVYACFSSLTTALLSWPVTARCAV